MTDPNLQQLYSIFKIDNFDITVDQNKFILSKKEQNIVINIYYQTKITKKILTIKNPLIWEYVGIYLLIIKMNPLFTKKIENFVLTFLKMVKLSSEEIKFVASCFKNHKLPEDLLNIFDVLTKYEILDYFNNDNLYSIINKKNNIELWLTSIDIHPKIDSDYVIINIIKEFVKSTVINDYNETILSICKKYNIGEIIFNILAKKNIDKNIVFKIFEKDLIAVLNTYYYKNSNIIFDKHVYIELAKNITAPTDDMYIELIKDNSSIWKQDKRFLKPILKYAARNNNFGIVCDFLNSDAQFNSNKYIAKFINNEIDYNNLSLLFKNCKGLDVLKILAYVDTRFIKACHILPEFLTSYITKEQIDYTFLKACFRINTYLKDLDRFNIKYDEKLYILCSNYYIYPDEYIQKSTIDKNVLAMRQFYYNNRNYNIYGDFSKIVKNNNLQVDQYTLANYQQLYKPLTNHTTTITIGRNQYEETPYTILRVKLFLPKWGKQTKITKLDDDIINTLNMYTGV